MIIFDKRKTKYWENFKFKKLNTSLNLKLKSCPNVNILFYRNPVIKWRDCHRIPARPPANNRRRRRWPPPEHSTLPPPWTMACRSHLPPPRTTSLSRASASGPRWKAMALPSVSGCTFRARRQLRRRLLGR